MPGTLIDVPEIRHAGNGGGGANLPPGGDGGGSGQSQPRVPDRAYFTAVQLSLAGIVMLFMALTSSFLVRKGLGNDWVAFSLPPMLWLNTAVLLASSGTLEFARRRLREGSELDFQRWWTVTTGLGLLFLAGQLQAWRQLASQGVFLSTNPSSSFFYLLTALHGLHLAGGIVALLCVGFRTWRGTRLTRATAAGLAAIYWHFMDGLWLFLLALLYLGR